MTPTTNASSADKPPTPKARPVGVFMNAPAAPPDSRWNNQKPVTSVTSAMTGMITGMRRRMSAPCTFAPSGPASANAGMRKNVMKANIPTHSAPDTTWRNRSTIISMSSP